MSSGNASCAAASTASARRCLLSASHGPFWVLSRTSGRCLLTQFRRLHPFSLPIPSSHSASFLPRPFFLSHLQLHRHRFALLSSTPSSPSTPPSTTHAHLVVLICSLPVACPLLTTGALSRTFRPHLPQFYLNRPRYHHLNLITITFCCGCPSSWPIALPTRPSPNYSLFTSPSSLSEHILPR